MEATTENLVQKQTNFKQNEFRALNDKCKNTL